MDDLLGLNITFSKLQDLLKQLIANANDQEAAIKLLTDESAKQQESLELRLAAQDAVVAQVKAQAEGSAAKLDEAVSKVEASQAGLANIDERLDECLEKRLKPVEQRLTPLERRVSDLEAKEPEVSKSLEALETALAGLGKTASALEARADKAEGQIAAQAKEASKAQASAKERLAELEDTVGSLVKLEEITEGLANSLDSLKESVDQVDSRTRAQEEQLTKLPPGLDDALQDLETFKAQCTEAKAASEAASEALDKRLSELDAKVKSDIEGLAKKESADAAAIKRLEDAVRAVQANSNLRGMIEALAAKMESDMGPLRRQLNELTARLNAFLDKGASATANCLCCGGTRATKHNKFMTGTDGKTYFRSANGDTVNLGRLASSMSSNLIVPSGGSPGRRVLSPVRSGTGKAATMPASLSTSAL